MIRSETFYRQTAGEGATYIGLLLVVYDTLAGDLRRAGQAVEAGEIAGRCDATNHALSLLGHLESWAASLAEVELRESLGRFYGFIRREAIALQAATAGTGFAELAGLVEETRAVWQQKEASLATRGGPAGERPATPDLQRGSQKRFEMEEQDGVPRGSWSA